jgi:TolB-like protein/DNA-binding SARP family transcriptional activator/Tfp pilus assembly protein PilF
LAILLDRTSTAGIRLRLLGRLALARGDDLPVRLSTRKAGALIAYLAMKEDQAASREELATLLWGSCSDQQARQSLRQALAFLRKDLGSAELFSAGPDIVRLKAGFWSVDARELEALSKSLDPRDLQSAAERFGGDFLTGLNIEEDAFVEWIRAQRARTQLAAARLCETFATRADLVLDGEQAVVAAERLLALDPLREDWQRLVLTLSARYRGTRDALARAEAFGAMMRRELDVGLEPATHDLVERIRNGEIAPVVTPPMVTLVPAAASASPESTADLVAQPDSARPTWRMRPLVAAVAIATVIAGGALGLLPYRPPSAQPPAPAAPQSDAWHPPDSARPVTRRGIIPLAVLPFAALGDTSPSTQLVADMITDDLINILSRSHEFRVISRQTTTRYKGQPVDLAAIGADLQVRYVLEGSARTEDGILRVNVQLFDPRTRLPVWSARVEREQGERLAVRDEIVGRIARELQINIVPIEGERRSADRTADASAYLGWAAMQAAFSRTSIDSYRKAEALFQEALARDPQHIQALVGMGSFHSNVAVQRLVPDPKAHFEKAREILTLAAERDPRNPSALLQLGILLQGTGKVREALELFEKVTGLNPSHSSAYAHIGHALGRLGQPEKGIEHIHYAMRLSPRDPALPIWHEFIGNARLELAQYPEAIESFERSAALAPRYPRPIAGLAAAHALAGNEPAAKASVTKLQAAGNAPADELLARFGRNPKSRLYQGLSRALAPAAPAAPPSDAWQPPQLPSERRAEIGLRGRGIITPIIVLPFGPHGTADPAEPLADVLTDDLTNMLSRVANLRVISRQTARRYRDRQTDVAAIGAELQVRYVLEGSVRIHGRKLRVNVELVDPLTRLPAWSTRIERPDDEHHAVLDEIVMRLARELHFEVLNADSERVSGNPDAYELSRLGWKAIFDHGTEGMAALTRAQAAFSQALERAPDNWSARSGLGAYHALVGSLRYGADWSEHLDKGEHILTQVMGERPNRQGPHFFLSIVHRMRGRLPEGVAALERCIEITPSEAPCYAHIGHALVQQGRAGEGLQHVNYALRLSPQDMTRSHWLRFAGDAEIELGHHDAAIKLLRESYAANPRQPPTLRSLAAAYALSGNMAEAQRFVAELKALAPHISAGRTRTLLDTMQPELVRGLRLAAAPRM